MFEISCSLDVVKKNQKTYMIDTKTHTHTISLHSGHNFNNFCHFEKIGNLSHCVQRTPKYMQHAFLFVS
jgi:hypothetical protein